MQPSSEPDDMSTASAPATPVIVNDGRLHELSQLHKPAIIPEVQVHSTTPDTQDHPDTSNDVLQLPQDVLVMCFNNLRGDTNTLARLARTSTHFQEPSTPILYNHRYFDDVDALFYGELLPLARVTERTPSGPDNGGQAPTEQPAGARRRSETQVDVTVVDEDRVGQRRLELWQLTKRLTIRAFDVNRLARLSNGLFLETLARVPLMRGVDTVRMIEHSKHDIHQLFGSNDSDEASIFRILLRSLVNPRHFCLEIVESAGRHLGIGNRCSCYFMLVEFLCSRWSRLETITIHTTHLMLDQRRFIYTPQRVRLRIFVALVGGDIKHWLKTDHDDEINSLARRTLKALIYGKWGRQGQKIGPIEIIFEDLDDEQVGVVQARMAELVRLEPIDGTPTTEVLQKGEDGCMKLKGVTLVAGKRSSVCMICGERGAYRGYEKLKPGSLEPCHAVGEIKPGQVTLIQDHDGGKSAETEQVMSIGDQAGDVATTRPEGEKQHRPMDNKNMPHDAAADIGQEEAKQETVSINVSTEHTKEPMAMEGHPHLDCSTEVGTRHGVKENDYDNDGVRTKVVGEQVELQQESPMMDVSQTHVEGMHNPGDDGGSVDDHPVTADMQTVEKEEDMA